MSEEYEVIRRPATLREKVRRVHAHDGQEDAVARAEAAVALLAARFEGWMEEEVEVLGRRWRTWDAVNFIEGEEREAFIRAVHDMKGQAATLGFPLIARVAASLCALVRACPDRDDLPIGLVTSHVEAIGAMFRERVRDAEDRIGAALAAGLEALSARSIEERSGASDAA